MIYIYNTNQTFDKIAQAVLQAVTQLKFTAKLTDLIFEDTAEDLYIIFGAHLFKGKLPEYYIVYQFEQTSSKDNRTDGWFSPEYLKILAGAQEVWDYSFVNINNLRKRKATSKCTLKYVPLLYSNVYRFSEPEDSNANAGKDIDVLFYGSVNLRRNKILQDLKKYGVKAEFNWNNLWDSDLNERISRAKIVLNLHFYDDPILETSRLSYLVSNGAFVISEPSQDVIADKAYQDLVVFSDYDHIAEECLKFLANPTERKRISTAGRDKYMQKNYSSVIPTELLTVFQEESCTGEGGSETKSAQKDPAPTLSCQLYGNALHKGKKGDGNYIIAETAGTPEGPILKLGNFSYNELPKVSIVTLTHNRAKIFEIACRNYRCCNYPIEKLEWVIVDDSEQLQQQQVAEMISGMMCVQHIRLPERVSISEKRNIGVSRATYDVIVHMDDDDYYPPDSVMTRVKLLLKHQREGAGCVGACQIGVYDIINELSYLMDTPYPSEASMAYLRAFWEQRNFASADSKEGEGVAFVTKRTDNVINMPYMFNLIAITHNSNITGKFRSRKRESDERYTNFFNLWDFDTQLFFMDMRKRMEQGS